MLLLRPRSWFVLPILTGLSAVNFVSAESAYSQASSDSIQAIVVSGRDLVESEVLATVPLVGFSPVPEQLTAEFIDGVPVEYAIEIFKSQPLIVRELTRLGFQTTTAKSRDWISAARSTSIIENASSVPVSLKSIKTPGLVVDSQKALEFFRSELFKGEPTFGYTTVNGQQVEILKWDPAVYRKVKTSYQDIYRHQTSDPIEAQQIWQHHFAELRSVPTLASAAKATLTDVSFGRPQVWTQAERDFRVPESISRGHDVYWIEFAISFRDEISKQADELNFAIDLPERSFAYDLFPLRYDRATQVEQTQKGEASAKVGTAVELGVSALMERKVIFERLVPIVYASGLQERTFTWTFQDTAIVAGSHRVVGLIAVPAATQSIQVKMFADARMKDRRQFAGGRATSTTLSTIVVLRP